MLNVGGTLVSLIRTLSCGFNLSESISLIDLENSVKCGTFNLIPAEKALENIPKITLAEPEAFRWCQGQKIPLLENNLELTNWRVFNEKTQLLGIANLINLDNQLILKPKIVLT